MKSGNQQSEATPLGSSFRDPAGFVYRKDGVLYRQINEPYQAQYEQLVDSGLYEKLVSKRWLVPHKEVPGESGSYKTIEPESIPFVSYPYEWCFSQLKDAALLTLDIQVLAIEHGMSLKDASAYNIQFRGCEPVFIDTLSFDSYSEGQPWVAYGQFCRHFLGPLALMAKTEMRLRQLLKSYIDGLPLDLVSQLLPMSSLANYGLLVHLRLHSHQQKVHQDEGRGQTAKPPAQLSKSMLLALITSLRNSVNSLKPPKLETEWGGYYDDTNYSDESMRFKEEIVVDLARRHFDESLQVHDLGANTGRFSRLIAENGHYVVSHDIDELAVERNYIDLKKGAGIKVLPLVLDLTNPSPALGWGLSERESTVERIDGCCVLALALIHHLAIGNNVPLVSIAKFLSRISDRLIIEFVPKADSQVQRMLSTREDIFPNYHQEGFVEAFSRYFTILEQCPIETTHRVMYAMSVI